MNQILIIAFETANTSKTGVLSFEEFKKFALNDSTITAWFDALGTVF